MDRNLLDQLYKESQAYSTQNINHIQQNPSFPLETNQSVLHDIELCEQNIKSVYLIISIVIIRF